MGISLIDWDKSSTPKSDRVPIFNGTEAESDWREIVTGTLVLTDGTVIPYVAKCTLNNNQFQSMQKFFTS